MTLHFIKWAIRSILKFRLYSAIKIGGLGIALAVSLIIFHFVRIEYNVDADITHKKHSYRLLRLIEDGNSSYKSATFSSPFKEALLQDLQGKAENIIRVYKSDELVIYEDKNFIEENFIYADTGFFNLFNFQFELGNPHTALRSPGSIILTKETSQRYFGGEDPLNKTLLVDNKYHYTVTGVIEKNKFKSHLDFDFVASIETLDNLPFMKDWDANTLNLYLIARKDIGQTLKNDFSSLSEKYFYKQKAQANNTSFLLQEFRDIYFENDVRFDIARHGDKKVLYSFLAIALIVLVIAASNFVNLSTALYYQKLKSTAVKKILGITKYSLFTYSLVESFITIFTALAFACLTSYFLVEYADNAFNSKLEFDILSLLILGVPISLVLTLLCSLYPIAVLSSLRPVDALKGKLSLGTTAISSRKILLLFQFSSTLVLIIVSFVMQKQFLFMQNKNLGFNQEQVLLFNSNNRNIYKNKDFIKQSISKHNDVLGISVMYGGVPGAGHDIFTYSVEGKQEELHWRTALVDENYFAVFGLQILTGRGFSPDGTPLASNEIVINETAAKELGWSNNEAIGKFIQVVKLDSLPGRKVIGVVKDYHFESLKEILEPLALIPDVGWGETFAVKLTTSDLQASIGSISAVWKGLAPQYPFTYHFLDDSFNRLYAKEIDQGRLFMFFTALSIVICCLGVIGLSTFFLYKRTKEIAIRKLVGASAIDIIYLLSKEFVVLVFVANLIAFPISWLAVNNWMYEFAYKTQIGVTLYLGSGLLLLLIIIFIVLAQSLNTAFGNQINNLRSE
jgi:putative ABC transport system permease protein